jgi:hypothetical protein
MDIFKNSSIARILFASCLAAACAGGDETIQLPADQVVPAASENAADLSADHANGIADFAATRFSEPSIERDDTGATVTFSDEVGRVYSYRFDIETNLESSPELDAFEVPDLGEMVTGDLGVARQAYKSEWHWWGVKYRLNRSETRELGTEGQNAAVVYGIATLLGCVSCVLGAAVEAGWATLARAYYDAGNCIHINAPYLTVGETRRNTNNCR